MNRNLSMERVFNLGAYETLRVGSVFVDVPGMDDTLISKIRLLQMLDIEKAYRKYLSVVENLGTTPQDEVLTAIGVATAEVIKDINNILNKEKEDENGIQNG